MAVLYIFTNLCIRCHNVRSWSPPAIRKVKLWIGINWYLLNFRPLCMRLPSCFKRNFVYCFRKLTVKRCLLTDSWDNHSRREGSLFNSCRLAFVMQCYARRHCHMQQYQRNLIAVVCNKWPRNFRFFLPDKIAGALQRWSRDFDTITMVMLSGNNPVPEKIMCLLRYTF